MLPRMNIPPDVSRFQGHLCPAKTIAAYIDLNPVRAGMVKDPADF
jgi:hypothetical protein